VPKELSDAFVAAVEGANRTRSAADRIALTYQVYPGANHDLAPHLTEVHRRDLAFYNAH
jgi:hypothetical protein